LRIHKAKQLLAIDVSIPVNGIPESTH
jgi:hypothetical protein